MPTSVQNSETMTPDRLMAGVDGLVKLAVTIVSGAGALVRGTVLGAVTKALGTVTAGTNTGNGTVTGVALKALAEIGSYVLTCIGGTFSVSRAANDANTGNGTFTLANPAFGNGVVAGVYTVTCIEPGSDGGTFRIEDPNGVEVGIATVGVAYDGVIKFTIADGSTDFAAGDRFAVTVAAAVGSNAGTFRLVSPSGAVLSSSIVAGTPYVGTHLNLTVNDGSADFAVGDSFTIPVAAGSGKAKTVNSANVDGSAAPVGVLLEPVNAASADVEAIMAIEGEFNERALVFGGSDTADTHRAALQAKGIILRESVAG